MSALVPNPSHLLAKFQERYVRTISSPEPVET